MKKSFLIIILLGITFLGCSENFDNNLVSTSIQPEELTKSSYPEESNILSSSNKFYRSKDSEVLSPKRLSELTYESEGLIKGVNSGSKPINISNKDSYSKDIYLGTCSRNVCRADTGVTSVSVALEFTDINQNKSQFSGDFDL